MPEQELTGKQRRYLRGMGNPLKAVVAVGLKGVNEGVLQAVAQAFHTSELIKVKLQEGFVGDRHEVAEQLARATQSHLVQVLGRTILLFRRHPEKPKLELP